MHFEKYTRTDAPFARTHPPDQRGQGRPLRYACPYFLKVRIFGFFMHREPHGTDFAGRTENAIAQKRGKTTCIENAIAKKKTKY